MLIPLNVLDGFVKAVKENSGFSDVRFIHAGKTSPAQMPVENFLIACGVGSVQKEKDSSGGCKHTAQLVFTVYAPYTAGSRELNKLSLRFMEALESADTEGVLQSIMVSDPVYDSDLGTMRQTVTAQAYYKVTPEEMPKSSTMPVIINGILADVLSLETSEEASVYELKELLTGDTGRRLDLGKEYTLKISVESAKDPFEGLSDIDITLDTGACKRTYVCCTLRKMTEHNTPKAVSVRDYTLSTRNMKTEEESD